MSIIWFWNIGYSIFLFVCKQMFALECWFISGTELLDILYNNLSNLEPFDLENEKAQYGFKIFKTAVY